MLYHNPYGERPLQGATSLLVPKQKGMEFRVHYRHIGVQVASSYRSNARVVLYVIEDGGFLVGNGKPKNPYDTLSARLHGRHSPGVEWEVTEGLDECRIVSIAASLVSDELLGESRKRAVYDMLWAALRKDRGTRQWLKENFPDWAKGVLHSLEEKVA
jgi:hypothetical protein